MSELITMDGKYQRRDGTPIRDFHIFSKQVVYESEIDEGFRYVSLDGRYWKDKESEFDLIPVPPAPRLVPLDASDVIPGKTLISRSGDADESRCLVVTASVFGLIYIIPPNDHFAEWAVSSIRGQVVSWAKLAESGLYSNDEGKTFQPCSKPETKACE